MGDIRSVDPLSVLYDFYQDNKDKFRDLSFGWEYEEVGCVIHIDSSGTFVSAERVGEDVQVTDKKTRWVGKETPVPIPPQRNSGCKPMYLYDLSLYMFGLEKDCSVSEKGLKNWKAYVALWSELEKVAPECDEIKAVIKFYSKYDPHYFSNQPVLCEAVKGGKRVIFQMNGGAELHNIPAVKKAVDVCIERQYENNARCICRFSGEEDAVCEVWRAFMDSTGAEGKSPTYYEANSFRRYGIEGGLNALVGVRSAWAIRTAFKWLLKHNSVVLGKKQPTDNRTVYLFWNDDGSDPISVRGLFESIRDQNQYEDGSVNPDTSPNCTVICLSFVGRKGIFFNDAFTAKLSEFDRHIQQFQDIVGLSGDKGIWSGVRAVVDALGDDKRAGDEFALCLLKGLPLSSKLMRLAIDQYRRFMFDGCQLNHWKVRLVYSLMTYGLEKLGLMVNSTIRNEKGEPMETRNECVTVNDACWLFGCLLACVHRMQEISVFDGRWRSGNVFQRIQNRALRTPSIALSTVESWYITKYSPCGTVDKRWCEIMRIAPDLPKMLPTRASLVEQMEIVHGFNVQMSYFYTPKKKEQSKTEEVAEAV